MARSQPLDRPLHGDTSRPLTCRFTLRQTLTFRPPLFRENGHRARALRRESHRGRGRILRCRSELRQVRICSIRLAGNRSRSLTRGRARARRVQVPNWPSKFIPRPNRP